MATTSTKHHHVKSQLRECVAWIFYFNVWSHLTHWTNSRISFTELQLSKFKAIIADVLSYTWIHYFGKKGVRFTYFDISAWGLWWDSNCGWYVLWITNFSLPFSGGQPLLNNYLAFSWGCYLERHLTVFVNLAFNLVKTFYPFMHFEGRV